MYPTVYVVHVDVSSCVWRCPVHPVSPQQLGSYFRDRSLEHGSQRCVAGQKDSYKRVKNNTDPILWSRSMLTSPRPAWSRKYQATIFPKSERKCLARKG